MILMPDTRMVRGLMLLVALGLLGAPAARAGEAKPDAKAASPKAPAAEGKKSTWKSLFDGKTLKGWKSPEFGGEGKVEIKDGAMVLGLGNMMTGIAYTGGDFPKTDYEVSLEAKRLEGSDFFATVTFPVGETHCSFVTGGWGGSVVGLSSIDYYDAADNQTTKFKDFKNGQWYAIRVRVSQTKIQAWIDDEKMVDQEIKGHKISIRFECDLCRPLGVANWCTSSAVRGIRMRALTADEKKADAEAKPGDEN